LIVQGNGGTILGMRLGMRPMVVGGVAPEGQFWRV
jgi:hypothetical protein